MQSKATTVEKYLKELPADRRASLQTVRNVILKNLDKDFEEGMQYGMIGYYVPHHIFPQGYHCDPRQPLPFAGLASQKNYMSVYLMTVYGEGVEENWFRTAWAKTGKKLDMGKCCIRFKKLEDLAMDVVGEAVRRVNARGYIEYYLAAIAQNAARSGAPRRAAPKKNPNRTTKGAKAVKVVKKAKVLRSKAKQGA